MKTLSIFSLLAIIGSLAFTGCVYNNEEDLFGPPPPIPVCDTLFVSFQNDINPLIQSTIIGCFGCHPQ